MSINAQEATAAYIRGLNYRINRLAHQADMAARDGHTSRQARKLAELAATRAELAAVGVR